MKKLLAFVLCMCMVFSAFPLFVFADVKTETLDLEFSEKIFECELTDDFKYAVIRSSEELGKLLLICRKGQYIPNEFVEYASTLPENYFDEKALVVVSDISESGAKYKIDRVYRENSFLNIEYTYDNNGEKPCDIIQYLITAEINQTDIKDVECVGAVKTDDSVNNIDFRYYNFENVGWQGDESDIEHLYGKNTEPMIVESFDELDEYKQKVSEYCNVEFLNYVDALSDNFFDENAILLVESYTCSGGYEYIVTSLCSYDSGLMLSYSYSGVETYEALSSSIIAVEFKKSDAKNLEKAFPPDVSNAMMNYLDNAIPAPESDKVGDVNGDNNVDADDYIVLKRLFFGTEDYRNYGKKSEQRSDINGNGKIDAEDYILLKRVYFGQYTIE